MAAKVSADRTGLRIDGHGSRTRILLQRSHLVIDCLNGVVLHIHVDGGGDAQAAGRHLVFGDAYLFQFADDLILDVAIGAGRLGVGGVLSWVAGLWEDHAIALFLGEVTHSHQAVKNVVPTVLGALLVHTRVEAGRRLNETGEHGAFLRSEILGVLIKVGVGRRLDAVGIAAEVHGVEVGIENILLIPLIGHLHRVDELANLAHVGVFVAHQRVFHILLGNGGTAASIFIAGYLTHHGAAEAGEGEAGVIPEVTVLRGQHGVLHVFRDFIQLHVGAVAFRRHQAGELGLIITRVDGGDLVIGQVLGLRNGVLRVCVSKKSCGQCHKDQ